MRGGFVAWKVKWKFEMGIFKSLRILPLDEKLMFRSFQGDAGLAS
jgi:hypothetical protein